MDNRRKNQRRKSKDRRTKEFAELIDRLIVSGRIQERRLGQRRSRGERRGKQIDITKLVYKRLGDRRKDRERRSGEFDELFNLMIKRGVFPDLRKFSRRTGERRKES